MNNSTPSKPTEEKKQHPMLLVLKNRNLRLLWIGEAFSVLGSQFYMIALPWLVLQLTGDPFQMGSVLALAGIPRAFFMLIGGVLTDRFSPKSLMISSNLVRMSVGIILVLLVINGWTQIYYLYLLSLIFGLADAFLFPAQSAILPQILSKEQLLPGNSVVQGTAQLSIAAGPALAGLIIALFSNSSTPDNVDVYGIAIAFLINSTSFFLSILFFIPIKRQQVSSEDTISKSTNVFQSLKEGLNYVYSDKTLVMLFTIAALSHFLVEGPLFIGIPLLAHTRFPEGAAAFGMIMSALGVGMLSGILAAGTLPPLKPEKMGTTLMGLLSLSGVALIPIGYMTSTYSTAFLTMIMGAAQGYVIIQFSTWIQTRTPERLLGRVLSMMMFASVGLVPVSQALCGALIKLSITGLFLTAGTTLTLVILMVGFRPEVKNMGIEE